MEYHVIAKVATLDASYSIQLWSKMIPKMQDTLNMLRTLRQNNNLMAYKEKKSKFDWNKTLIAPLGTKAMVCIATNARNTFAPHCDEVFVTSMALHHYLFLDFLCL